MSSRSRQSQIVHADGADIETYVDGDGPAFVILPSYGRDGGDDYDNLTAQLVGAGWKVLRPQPRGVGRSQGQMTGLTLHDLANDVASCIRSLGASSAVLLGHAFGNVLARVVTTAHPELVKAVVLAAAEGSKVPEDIGKTPFIAGDLSAPEAGRLAALRQAFFAPNHDASIWLQGWYPETLKMEHEAAKASGVKDSWACGNVPLLQIIAEYDPFIPKSAWGEMHDEFGDRVTVSVIKDASHALFPEQPEAVARTVIDWAQEYRS